MSELDTRDSIAQAVEQAASGDTDGALALLRPVLLGPAERDEALFALAYVNERCGKITTAEYLYREVLRLHPDFEPALARMERVARASAELGFIEDFHDSGHRRCGACRLQHRAEYSECPYCGTDPRAERETEAQTAGEGASSNGQPEAPDWARDVIRWFRDVTDKPGVQRATDRFQDFVSGAGEQAREIGEKPQVQSASREFKRFGEQAAAHLHSLSETELAAKARERLDALREELADKAKTLSESDEVKRAVADLREFGKDSAAKIDDWTRSDNVQEFESRVQRFMERMIAKLRRWLQQTN